MTPTILALILAAGLPVPPQASQLPPWYRWLFEAFRPAGGGSGTILTVTGVSPLALVNALSAPIHSLTQYGKCVQNGTPTPSAPVDILCNNGVLRYGALGSNLYDPSTAVFEVGYYYSPAAEGAQTAAANNFIYHAYIPIEAGAAYVFYGRKKDTNRISQYNRIHFYDAEKTYISTNTYVAGTIGTGVAPDNAVYARLSCNPQGASTAISEETVLGYNWTFCKGTEEVTPFVPFVGGIYTDGTPEVLTVRGKNLFDSATRTTGYYISEVGVPTGNSGSYYSALIPVQPNTTYVYSGNSLGGNKRLHAYDKDGNWIEQISYTVYGTPFVASGTTPANCKYVRISGSLLDTDVQLELGSIATAYEPYNAQTVSVPMLLGVGDYKDAAELIQGIKTGRVGIKVLTGGADEIWGYSQTSGIDRMNLALSDMSPANYGQGLCTHLKRVSSVVEGIRFGASNSVLYVYLNPTRGFSSAALWKAFLAAQYAAGTPVIVLYPLATETTEQTTAHALHSYNGTTIVTAQTNVDPVTLRVEYKGVST